jgi:pyruvate formate lyase activating enzyme
MQEARHYTPFDDGRVQCNLCPHQCLLDAGETGMCRSRKNILGRLIAENYGKLTALHLDPIEKKPLFHFFPGSQILSAGSFGCNLKCAWCQNCDISQSGSESFSFLPNTTPANLAETAAGSKGIGLAYTYNEPTVWFEFMMDTAVLVKEAGLKNVVVTNGYINPAPLVQLLEVAHAFNTDLKGFSEDFFRTYSGGSLKAVKKTLLAIARSGLHQEVTYLAIPGLNDDPTEFQEMVQWIHNELGPDTPLHLSRYFPAWNLLELPTPVSMLRKMYEMARKYLHFVYLGNVAGHPELSATRCPGCGTLLAERHGFLIRLHNTEAEGRCSQCGEKVFVM